ncbi:hypothetical protein PspLS_02402, partial [Pyricularia sp. CBS 133598]
LGTGLQSKPTGPLTAGKVGFSNGSIPLRSVQAIAARLAQVHDLTAKIPNKNFFSSPSPLSDHPPTLAVSHFDQGIAPRMTGSTEYATGATADPEVGYPKGHLGHLTDSENKALSEFKVLIAENGLYTPGPPPSHDDQTLLRFLRARRWVPQDAFKQFKETEEWRSTTRLDTLYDTIELDSYEQSRIMYPQWTGRRDKRGIPVYLFEIKQLDSKAVAAYEKGADDTFSRAHADGSTPPKLLRLFALYENLTRFAQPLCTEMPDRPHPQTPITLSTNIVDVSGVSLRQFWNLKAHMQAASTLATAHYPETLDRIFVIGAPFFFSTVWGWIKRWFDPITVSKIFILSQAEVFPVLSSFMEVENIPKQYGGKLEFKWCDQPNLDPAIKKRATWEQGFDNFPKGPVLWKVLDEERLECVAVGSVNQKQRNVRVCTLPRSFKGVVSSNQPYHKTEATAATPDVAAVETGVQKLEIHEAKSDSEAVISTKEEIIAEKGASAVDAPAASAKAA